MAMTPAVPRKRRIDPCGGLKNDELPASADCARAAAHRFCTGPAGQGPAFSCPLCGVFCAALAAFFQVIFSKGAYNRKWYIVGRGAALPRVGHLLDPVAPAAASPHPVGAGGLGGPISFSSERNGGKNAAKNQWFLDFLCPI